MPTFPRLGRAPSSRARKTKNFLTFPFKTAGGAGGSRKKNERKFYGFVFVASSHEHYMALWHITQWNIIL